MCASQACRCAFPQRRTNVNIARDAGSVLPSGSSPTASRTKLSLLRRERNEAVSLFETFVIDPVEMMRKGAGAGARYCEHELELWQELEHEMEHEMDQGR